MRAHLELSNGILPSGPSGKPARSHRQLVASWAASEADVRDAQRLRYSIFAGELGAGLNVLQGSLAGCDADRFDSFCDHLLVHAIDPLDAAAPQLVGTYRVLGPDGARRAGGYYSESEFDIAPLRPLCGAAVELGRACVRAEFRTGGVIMALWSALGGYMLRHGFDTMFGCASIGMADGGKQARRIWRHASEHYLVAPRWQLRPLQALEPVDESSDSPLQANELPPLLKGYLRCGAKVLGPPSVDRRFNTADLPIMLRLDELAPRYRKQFLSPQ